MGHVIAFAGQKGGVGKSSAAVNFAAEARARGFDVVLVDADPQGTARTWHATATELGHTAPEVVCLGEELHKRVPELAKRHGLVVIDTPPRHAEIQRACLMTATVVLLPAAGSPADAWALVGTAKLVEAARKVRPKLDARVLLSRLKAGTTLGRTARAVLGGVGLPLVEAELRERIAYQEALAAGLGITEYAPGTDAAEEMHALVTEVLGATGERRSRRGR